MPAGGLIQHMQRDQYHSAISKSSMTLPASQIPSTVKHPVRPDSYSSIPKHTLSQQSSAGSQSGAQIQSIAYHSSLSHPHKQELGMNSQLSSQLHHKQFPPYSSSNSFPKHVSKRGRGAKTSVPRHMPSSTPHYSSSSAMDRDNNDMNFTADSSPSSTVAKLPIQALRRSQPAPAPAKRQPKQKVIPNTYQPILPLPPSTSQSSVSTNKSTAAMNHSASSSPAIQAALNKPVIGGKRAAKRSSEVN